MQFDVQSFKTPFFQYLIGLCALAMLSAIGMYSYLGTYSRYLADDYCETALINKSSPINAVLERYVVVAWSTGARPSMRYSNLLFVGFSELLGNKNMQITMSAMVFLWVAGLIWFIHEIRRSLKINWFFQMDLFLGAALGFFSLLLAPNLFQTIYWRSAMMTHFAPLIFGSFLFAFLLKQARHSESRPISLLVYLFTTFAAFIFAGFSEPPTTTLITVLPLLMLAVWYWGKTPAKQRQGSLLACTLAGAILGLMAMALSPAVANSVQESSPNIVTVLLKSFLYGYQFMIDSLQTLPLPFFVCTLIALLLIWVYKQVETSALSDGQKRTALQIMIALPFLAWLLIAAGFSPSVYGQGYPVARMRFLARTLMIVALMLEGALLGLLLKDIFSKYNMKFIKQIVLALFAVLSIVYPLRAAYTIYKLDLPKFRTHAQIWDQRDAQIRQSVAQGATDLVVVQIDGMDGVLEYKENNWVNKCAADYYGLDTLSAP